MDKPKPPIDEAARIAALHRTNLLDTPAEERFDRITRLTTKTLDVPIALVSLVDRERQWFKSRQGLSESETTRAVSFCGYTIHDDEAFVVPDALADDRFADNPLVTGGPQIRLYAGKAIHSPDGHRIGTLCIIDSQPRKLDNEQLRLLGDLAALVETEVRVETLSDTERELRTKLSLAERAAAIDSLTQLWNRGAILQALEIELRRAERGGLSTAVLMIDMDHFKVVNDEYGHLVGDYVLEQTSARMRSALRTYDSLGRYGGDEFLAILPESEIEGAQAIAERLRESVADRPISCAGRDWKQSVSVGAAARVVTNLEGGAAALIDAADQALYRAKRSRNTVATGE